MMATVDAGNGHAIAYTKFGVNSDRWLSGGAPVVLSRRSLLGDYVGDSGTVWVVVGRRHGRRYRYNLTYRLENCEPFIATGLAAEKFGRFGIRGDAGSSQWFASNDMWQVLMALHFDPFRPIATPGKSHGKIAQSLQRQRLLTERDVLLLEAYASYVASGWTVFVSHASEDAAVAEQVRNHLEGAGVSVFLDRVAIRLGDRWEASIEAALAQCRVLVVLCSAKADSSEWVAWEVGEVLKRRPRAVIVPVRLEEGTKLWERLAKYQGLRWPEPTGPGATVRRRERDLLRRLAAEVAVR